MDAPLLLLYQTPFPFVNVYFVLMHKFSVLHNSFLCILYNTPYCNPSFSVLFYKHKKEVLQDFLHKQTAHRWKAVLAEKPTDAKSFVFLADEPEIFRMQTFLRKRKRAG